MGKCGIHGSVADSTKEAPSFTITNFKLTGDVSGLQTKTNGQTANFNNLEVLACRITINVGGGHRGAFVDPFNLTHLEFGAMGSGMIGQFIGMGPSSSTSIVALTGGAVELPTQEDFACMMTDTGNLRVAADSITIRDLISGLSVTGPGSNFTVTVVVS